MLRIDVISGKLAGRSWEARRFPFVIGRASECDIVLEEPGIWPRHLTVDISEDRRFVLRYDEGVSTAPSDSSEPSEPSGTSGSDDAGEAFGNGAVLDLGAVKARLSLGRLEQRGSRGFESGVWALLVIATVVEIAVIYWLSSL